MHPFLHQVITPRCTYCDGTWHQHGWNVEFIFIKSWYTNIPHINTLFRKDLLKHRKWYGNLQHLIIIKKGTYLQKIRQLVNHEPLPNRKCLIPATNVSSTNWPQLTLMSKSPASKVHHNSWLPSNFDVGTSNIAHEKKINSFFEVTHVFHWDQPISKVW